MDVQQAAPVAVRGDPCLCSRSTHLGGCIDAQQGPRRQEGGCRAANVDNGPPPALFHAGNHQLSHLQEAGATDFKLVKVPVVTRCAPCRTSSGVTPHVISRRWTQHDALALDNFQCGRGTKGLFLALFCRAKAACIYLLARNLFQTPQEHRQTIVKAALQLNTCAAY